MIESKPYFDYICLGPDQAFDEEILRQLRKRPLTSLDLSFYLKRDIQTVIQWLKKLLGEQKIVRIENGQYFYKIKKCLKVKKRLIPENVVSLTIFKHIGKGYFKPIYSFRK